MNEACQACQAENTHLWSRVTILEKELAEQRSINQELTALTARLEK